MFALFIGSFIYNFASKGVVKEKGEEKWVWRILPVEEEKYVGGKDGISLPLFLAWHVSSFVGFAPNARLFLETVCWCESWSVYCYSFRQFSTELLSVCFLFQNNVWCFWFLCKLFKVLGRGRILFCLKWFCLFAYVVFASSSGCFQTQYEKALIDIHRFLEEQNENVYLPVGLHITDPIERGMRVVSFTNSLKIVTQKKI